MRCPRKKRLKAKSRESHKDELECRSMTLGSSPKSLRIDVNAAMNHPVHGPLLLVQAPKSLFGVYIFSHYCYICIRLESLCVRKSCSTVGYSNEESLVSLPCSTFMLRARG
jgi:hypothetical protein